MFRAKVVVIAAVAVLLAACGHEPAPNASGPNACSLLTTDEIQQATGTVGSNPQLPGNEPALCVWDSKGEQDIEIAVQNDGCQSFRKGDKVQTVSGLGDEAYSEAEHYEATQQHPETMADYFVCVVKGAKSFWISYELSPTQDPSQQTMALAKAALSHLS